MHVLIHLPTGKHDILIGTQINWGMYWRHIMPKWGVIECDPFSNFGTQYVNKAKYYTKYYTEKPHTAYLKFKATNKKQALK